MNALNLWATCAEHLNGPNKDLSSLPFEYLNQYLKTTTFKNNPKIDGKRNGTQHLSFLPGVFVGGELVAGKKGNERRHEFINLFIDKQLIMIS